MASAPQLLTLAANHAKHARGAGYTLLADYLKGAERIKTRRSEPKGALERMAVAVVSRFSFTRWYRWGSAELEWKAWKRLQQFDGVIHILWADRDLGFIDLLRNKKRHRFCATFHGSPITLRENIHFPSRLKRFDAIILMSEVQREFFEMHGVPADRIHVVLHGVDTVFFQPAPNRPIEDIFEVLSVGSYDRDFGLLQETCRILAGEKSIRFKIVAPIALRRMFDKLPNVTFVADLSSDDLLRTYHEASCFLLTVQSATANNALLEAMACGLPVIAQAVGGIPEYVGSDGAAELVKSDSAESLAQQIRLLARDPGKCAQLGVGSRRRAEQLDWTLVAERTERIYQSIL